MYKEVFFCFASVLGYHVTKKNNEFQCCRYLSIVAFIYRLCPLRISQHKGSVENVFGGRVVETKGVEKIV